ncbi:MAG: LPS export ABC transporter permease LptF [Methyloligellaceae bacterium]
MDTYSKHVFKQVASSLLLILISLTLIVWMATALKQLKLVTSQGQSFFIFLQMTTLALPSLMGFVAPIALLIACLHILNRVDGDSELIVMNAGGANIWRIAKPYLLLSMIVAVALLLSNLYLQPYSLRTLKEYVIKVRTDLISQVLQPEKFSSPEKGLMFHIREKSPEGDLLGLVINDSRDEKQVMTYLAERGRIVQNGENAYLVMQQGHIQRKDGQKKTVQIIAFQQYIFDLTSFGPDTKNAKRNYKPRERYLNELLNPARNDPYYKRSPGKLRAEVHDRFVTPLYPLVFAILAVAMIGQVRSTRQRSLNGVFLAFGLAIFVKVLGVASANMIAKKAALVPVVYIIPIGAFLLAAFWMQSNAGLGRRKKQ